MLHYCGHFQFPFKLGYMKKLDVSLIQLEVLAYKKLCQFFVLFCRVYKKEERVYVVCVLPLTSVYKTGVLEKTQSPSLNSLSVL